MRNFLVIIFFILVWSGCSDENELKQPELEWNKLGLDGKTINQMELSDETLYVATTTGLFKIRIDETGNEFELLGFDSKNVQAVQLLGDREIIVSLVDKTGAEPPALHRSINDGETWTPVDSNFGDDHAEPLLDFELHPDHKNVLFATGLSVVARSEDQGETWEPVYGDWGGFATGISVVEVNPENTSEIWAGGQGAIENGFLLRTTDEEEWEQWTDLVDNPTVVKEITFSKANDDHVFVGFEGALLRTSNGGETWQTLIDSEVNRFFFGICLREGNSNRVYAGGWIKTPDPQPLVLYISNSAGNAWHEYPNTPEAYGGILEMVIKSEPGKDRLFLGLDKGGVYEVIVVN